MRKTGESFCFKREPATGHDGLRRTPVDKIHVSGRVGLRRRKCDPRSTPAARFRAGKAELTNSRKPPEQRMDRCAKGASAFAMNNPNR